ncbi:hypothetical protein [Methylocaldum sp. GT1TLB]|jgi:hypothetical protein|uniref:hypothetical protein n=1 Tax=unclassified Methylocaldum TaxID=2622260 RepID=UPI003DA05BB4
MPKNWNEISDDEILNFEDAHTGKMARYERIMQQKSIQAAIGLRDKVTGLMGTIYRASQGLQEKTTDLISLYEKISNAQSRQQKILIALSIVVAVSTAVYTVITWQSVAAMREANEIQRQFLELEKSKSVTQNPPNKPLKPMP